MATAAKTGTTVTCLRSSYSGYDGETEINLAYGDKAEVSKEKYDQLQADFGECDPAWFDFSGKDAPKKRAAEPEDAIVEDDEAEEG